MIDFDVKFGWNHPASCSWHVHKDGSAHATIFLCIGQCGYCSAPVLNENDYMHLLEHEIFEAAACTIAVNDGLDPRNWKGFNGLFAPLHYKTKFHICGENCVKVRIG